MLLDLSDSLFFLILMWASRPDACWNSGAQAHSQLSHQWGLQPAAQKTVCAVTLGGAAATGNNQPVPNQAAPGHWTSNKLVYLIVCVCGRLCLREELDLKRGKIIITTQHFPKVFVSTKSGFLKLKNSVDWDDDVPTNSSSCFPLRQHHLSWFIFLRFKKLKIPGGKLLLLW